MGLRSLTQKDVSVVDTWRHPNHISNKMSGLKALVFKYSSVITE